MGAEHRLARATLEEAHRTFAHQVHELTIDEALDAAGGYRSILGVMKHVASWSAVYHSHAFDDEPRHWDEIEWPRGLRDRIEPTERYVEEILGWFERTAEA